MAANGAVCSGVHFQTGSTVQGSRSSFIDCSGSSNGDTSIFTFTNHAAALAYAHHQINIGASLNSPAAEVVGSDWTVNTSPSFATKVQSAVGGQIISGQPVTPSTAPPPPKPKPHTLTYIVLGTPGAQVTYGPSGSNFNGQVPMRITAPLRHPQYYAIDAQVQGGGSVTCKIKVDGKTISQANASGGYNIASCEIDQNPLTGQWENTNG
jgi:hypothetical protein